MVGADTVEQEPQRLPVMRQAVAVNIAQIGAGPLWQAIELRRSHRVRVVETAELIGQKSPAMGQHDAQRWVPFEQAGDDQSDGRDCGLEWEPDDVLKVVALDAANVADVLRMQKHQYAETLGGSEDRCKAGVIQIYAINVRA